MIPGQGYVSGKLSPAHVVFESFDVKRAQIFFELKAGDSDERESL